MSSSRTSKSSRKNQADADAPRTTTARERLLAERGRQQKSASRRRRAVIGIVAVVVVAGGTGTSIALAGGGTPKAVSSAPVTVPAHASGPGGTVVVYGKADAPHTLVMYEDLRCPICDKLEKTDGATIRQLADDGTYKIEYHMATFLDRNLGGSGSENALAAVGAALQESPQMFESYRTVLYDNQPDEQVDGFADTTTLLNLARTVPGLVTPAFEKAVESGTYKPWAEQVGKAFDDSGVNATPTVQLDGTTLNLFDSSGAAISPAQFRTLVQQTVSAAAK